MSYIQHIMKEGEKLSIAKFAKRAIEHLKNNTMNDNEVVKLASDIKELENNHLIPPRNIHPLPDGYKYRFSGYFGQIIGICRTEN